MYKEGIIVNSTEDTVKVAIHRTSGCGGSCKTCSGCDTPQVFVDLPNKVSAKIGDKVLVKANNSRVFLYSFLIYFVPLLFFIGGIGLSYVYLKDSGNANYDVLSFLVGLVFLAISGLLLKTLDKKIGKSDASFMEIEEIIGSIVN